jgi:hypothetical protein
MTEAAAKDLTRRQEAASASAQTSLRARMQYYALLGLIVVGGWLNCAINAVFGLYDATLQIARYTNLCERTTDVMAELSEASESLDRYVRNGEVDDLSRHDVGRTGLTSALNTIAHERNSAG